MSKIKVMTIFGVRPEAIKMAPLILELQRYDQQIESIVCVTAQHRKMLDQVLEAFNILPQYDLDIMQEGQTLSDITIRVLQRLDPVMKQEKPDLILVHGDTLTSFVASYVAFLHKIKVGHVEAGLRTWNKQSPYPEEMNRQLTGVVADLHFAPTAWAATNLQKENKPPSSIYVTGNTVTDVFQYTVRCDYTHPILDWARGKKLILLTAHRRESQGLPHRNVFHAVKRIADEFQDVAIVYPVHPSPIVKDQAYALLGNHPRIRLIDPLEVVDLHNFYPHTYLILTDSGGLQEEAPSFGIPVLVLRDTTERPEGVQSGTLKLVGTEEHDVYVWTKRLLTEKSFYKLMSETSNPYGDGKASSKIVEAILYHYGLRKQPPELFEAIT